MTLAHKYSLVAGVAYLALGVVGSFRTGLSGGYLSALAVMPGTTPDNFLHLATAIATLVLGTGLLRALRGGGQTATANP